MTEGLAIVIVPLPAALAVSVMVKSVQLVEEPFNMAPVNEGSDVLGVLLLFTKVKLQPPEPGGVIVKDWTVRFGDTAISAFAALNACPPPSITRLTVNCWPTETFADEGVKLIVAVGVPAGAACCLISC